ncbi:MAG: sulfite exporter TauE/SafE family protein [Clostridia bacterium]|jgi:uncharacterized membrane protein YfcA|nr:sulfite exporter TauE/SafE family protein [Clostridia bacterium]MBR7159657.1 sulfite exporter TauE/SafE family protein [Clostridia bacterium]
MQLDILFKILAGVLGGVISGMGMGGGTLLIPILTIFLDISQPIAQCVNLVSFVPVAIASLIVHIKNKLVKFDDILYLIVPSVITGVLSSILMMNIDKDTLRFWFGIFLIVLGVWIGVQSIFLDKSNKK